MNILLVRIAMGTTMYRFRFWFTRVYHGQKCTNLLSGSRFYTVTWCLAKKSWPCTLLSVVFCECSLMENQYPGIMDERICVSDVLLGRAFFLSARTA